VIEGQTSLPTTRSVGSEFGAGPRASSDLRRLLMGTPTDPTKLKVGARVDLFDGAPDGKGEIIDGPDNVGNWKVRWDAEWEGARETWEGIGEEDVV